MKEKISIKSVILIAVILLPIAVSVSNLAGKDDGVKLNFLEIVGSGVHTAEAGESSELQEDTEDTGTTAANSTGSFAKALLPKNAIVVDISGEIESPGVYMLQDGSRIFDAVEAAGGLTKNADINYINRAEILTDGIKIYIPSIEETLGSQPAAAAGMRTSVGSIYSTLININTASSEELQQIPGVGPSTAEKIIAYRTTHGKFSSVDELINISGIGAKTLEKMKGYITAR